MTDIQEAQLRVPTFLDVCAELHKNFEKVHTLNRLVNTDAKIAQTPKELIWTLNKAKLYRYVPQVPEDKLHKIPLFLVFAIMNRPACARLAAWPQLRRIHGQEGL